MAEFSICLEEITETEDGASWIFCGLLEADIIISSKFCPASSEILISWSAAVTSIVCDPKPIEEIVILNGNSEEVFNEKLPSKSEEVPVLVPSTTIFTPGRGCWSESEILPDIVDCASAIFPTKSMSEKIAVLIKLFVFICLVFICLVTYV